MSDRKRQTVETYNRAAEAMARKFDGIGACVEDVSRVFDLVGKERPAGTVARRRNSFGGRTATSGWISRSRSSE